MLLTIGNWLQTRADTYYWKIVFKFYTNLCSLCKTLLPTIHLWECFGQVFFVFCFVFCFCLKENSLFLTSLQNGLVSCVRLLLPSPTFAFRASERAGVGSGETQMVFHCRKAVFLYWVALFTQRPRNLWLASVCINVTSYLWGFQVTKLSLQSWSYDCVCLFPLFSLFLSLSPAPPPVSFPLSLFLPSFLLIIIGTDPLKTQGHLGSRGTAQS